MRSVWIPVVLAALAVLWLLAVRDDGAGDVESVGETGVERTRPGPSLQADAEVGPEQGESGEESADDRGGVPARTPPLPPASDGYGLDVVVADPDGKPVPGAHLWLYGASARNPEFNFNVEAETDADGRARLAWDKAAWDGEDPTAAFELAHSRSEDGIPLVGDIRTHPLVRVAFPHYAHVHVHIVRPDGKPAETAMRVDWYRTREDGEWLRTNDLRARPSTSTAKFRFLDPAWTHGFRARGGKVFFPGPITEVGQLDPRTTIDVRIETGERRPILECVLHGNAGVPLANAKIGVWFLDMPARATLDAVRMARGHPAPTWCTTDWLGRLRQAVRLPEQGGRRRWLRLQHDARSDDGTLSSARLHVELDGWAVVDGVVDLGELTLR